MNSSLTFVMTELLTTQPSLADNSRTVHCQGLGVCLPPHLLNDSFRSDREIKELEMRTQRRGKI